jgi:hypothetical protein
LLRKGVTPVIKSFYNAGNLLEKGDLMKINSKKIVLSSLAVAALAFTGCGGGGGGDAGTAYVPPVVPVEVDATFYSGVGAADISERHLANDAAAVNYPAYDASKVQSLFGEITTNTLLTADKQWKVSGLVTVKNGATLTIEPGTVIFGDATGDDFIVIAKGAKINASGTAASPIIFTSEIALMDPTKAAPGQWGGLTVLGAAPTNHANPFYEVDETNPDFSFGNLLVNTGDAADNSGILRHVHILNSGVTMSTDQEINGLSLAGVGSGTVVENITVVNSSDDCIEIWGGTVDVSNATMINCQDDSFDLDYGYVGNATNIKVYQTTVGHAGFEISSGGTTPMTAPTITNFVISKVSGSDEGGIYIKDDSTAPTFVNGEVMTQGSTDAGIHTKVAFSVDQKAAIAFNDVLFNSTLQADGAGSTDALSKVAYPVYKIDSSVAVSGEITADTTWTAGKQYKLSGLVTVKNSATLTIEPGTVVYGDATGDDYLVVAKGAKIIANGTDALPIYFTSEASLLDPTAGDIGQWGGLTVLGDAPTNHTNPFYEVDETNPDFAFGGTTAADNSGSLKNVHILNSGVTMSTDQEINGLSLAGVGSGTVVDNIYVGNSSDDGIEIWGGTVNVTNATMVNCQDDSFDLDYGYVGNATNIYVHQTQTAHAGFEISSGGTTPMTSPTIRNFVISKVNGSDEGGIYIKDDTTAPIFVNGIVTTVGSDANLNAKKVFTSEQKTAIAFKDVQLLK